MFPIPLFAVLDRLCGWKLGPGVVRLLLVPAIVFAVFFLVQHVDPLTAALFGLAFLVSRDPKWTLTGGDSHPYPRQVGGTLLRHLFALGFAWPLHRLGVPLSVSLPALSCYAAVATALGLQNRRLADKGMDINGWVETLRGLTLDVIVLTPAALYVAP